MKVLNKLKRSQEDFNMLPIEFVNSDTNQYICYLLRTIEGGGLPLPWSKEDKYKFADEQYAKAILEMGVSHYAPSTLRNLAEIHAEHWSNYLLAYESDGSGDCKWVRFNRDKNGKLFAANRDGESLWEIDESEVKILAIPRH